MTYKLYLSIDNGTAILYAEGTLSSLKRKAKFWNDRKGIRAWIQSPKETEEDAAHKAHIRQIFKRQ